MSTSDMTIHFNILESVFLFIFKKVQNYSIWFSLFEMVFVFSKWIVIFRNEGTIFECHRNIRMDFWLFEYQKNYSYRKIVIRIDFYYSNRFYSNGIIRMLMSSFLRRFDIKKLTFRQVFSCKNFLRKTQDLHRFQNVLL